MKEPLWVEVPDALILHERLIAEFGGAGGMRDRALLQSALARAKQIFAYAESPDLHEMAAAYISGIVRNHPFVDGNKRTGFLAGALFLEMNGLPFTADEEAAARAVIDLATGDLDDSGLAAFLRAHGPAAPSVSPPRLP